MRWINKQKKKVFKTRNKRFQRHVLKYNLQNKVCYLHCIVMNLHMMYSNVLYYASLFNLIYFSHFTMSFLNKCPFLIFLWFLPCMAKLPNSQLAMQWKCLRGKWRMVRGCSKDPYSDTWNPAWWLAFKLQNLLAFAKIALFESAFLDVLLLSEMYACTYKCNWHREMLITMPCTHTPFHCSVANVIDITDDDSFFMVIHTSIWLDSFYLYCNYKCGLFYSLHQVKILNLHFSFPESGFTYGKWNPTFACQSKTPLNLQWVWYGKPLRLLCCNIFYMVNCISYMN